MIEKLGVLLSALPKELYVFIISMLPIVELRGAIPVGAALNIPFYLNYLIAVVGNLLPVPFILMFIPKILDFMASFKFFRPVVEWLRKKADKNSGKILKTKGSENGENVEGESAEGESGAEEGKKEKMSWGIFTALMIFVAVPLPGTGAWTGTLIASVLGLEPKKCFLAAVGGVLVATAIMTVISYCGLGAIFG